LGSIETQNPETFTPIYQAFPTSVNSATPGAVTSLFYCLSSFVLSMCMLS
jgi:hypothetical protein